jgi:hypothetical protein
MMMLDSMLEKSGCSLQTGRLGAAWEIWEDLPFVMHKGM